MENKKKSFTCTCSYSLTAVQVKIVLKTILILNWFGNEIENETLTVHVSL